MQFRTTLTSSDPKKISFLLESTGLFSKYEVNMGSALALETLANSDEYSFIFAEEDNLMLGYACYGEIPCTTGSFDLYWIAVDKRSQGKGIGKLIMDEVEKRAKMLYGRAIYAETSGKKLYIPTVKFYESYGFKIVARLKDFYCVGDDKIILCKTL